MEFKAVSLLPKLILVLLLGSGDGAPTKKGQSSALRQDKAVPATATLELGRLRTFVATNPELQKLLYDGTKPEVAREQAAIQLGQVIGVGAETLKATAGRIQRLNLKLFGFGEQEHQFRVFAEIRKSPGQPLLPPLLDKWAEAVGEYEYQDQTVHSVTTRQGMGVWFVELEEAILLGTDPLLVESALLGSPQKQPEAETLPAPPADNEEAFLSLQIAPQVFLGQVLHVIGRHDRDEFLAVSSMFDLAALQKMKVSYDGKRLHARALLAPKSLLGSLLAPPSDGPAVLTMLPDNVGLALAASVKNPTAVWNHIGEVINRIEGMGRRDQNRRGEMEEIKQHFQERYSLSLDKDVFGNLQSAAYVVAKLRNGRDLERNMAFLLSARDADSSRTALQSFMKGVHRNDPGIGGVQEGEALVWRSPRMLAASCRNQVLIGNPRGEGFDRVLKSVIEQKSSLGAALQKRFPKASFFGVLDLRGLLPPGDNKNARLIAGLWLKEDQLHLAIDGSLPTLLAPAIAAMGRARDAARKTMSISNLKQITMGIMMYADDHDGQMPATLNDLGDYIGDAHQLLRCPISGQPYVYNKAIAGKKLAEIRNPTDTPVVYSPVSRGVDGGAIAYADGHVRWFPRARGYEDMIRKLKQATIETDPAGNEEEEVF